MGLFSKLKDYNLELDDVLDKKTFFKMPLF